MDKLLNGFKTYSKAKFSGAKHPRAAGGSFAKKGKTEEEDVSYHHKFSSHSHPRGKDGAFSNQSEGCQLGSKRYGGPRTKS